MNFETKLREKLKTSFQPSNPTPVKLFKEIELYKGTITSDPAKRIEIFRNNPRYSSLCFLVKNFMSESECEHYIRQTEQVGFSSLEEEYPVAYRNNDRVLFYSEDLAKQLWHRLIPFFKTENVIRTHPLGFGNAGTWKPIGLNACFKFGKYIEGRYFSPHIDGPWIPSWDLASVYTVIIYLNHNFDGGATELLITNDFWHDTVPTVFPLTGKAFIFRHDVLHEGKIVTKGTKYILRTEVMFQRVDMSVIKNPYEYEKVKNFFLQFFFLILFFF